MVVLAFFVFFFNDTATTEIYTLSLHDALPISTGRRRPSGVCWVGCGNWRRRRPVARSGRRSGRTWIRNSRSEEHTSELQSRHISYAVFCLKKKKKNYYISYYIIYKL